MKINERANVCFANEEFLPKCDRLQNSIPTAQFPANLIISLQLHRHSSIFAEERIILLFELPSGWNVDLSRGWIQRSFNVTCSEIRGEIVRMRSTYVYASSAIDRGVSTLIRFSHGDRGRTWSVPSARPRWQRIARAVSWFCAGDGTLCGCVSQLPFRTHERTPTSCSYTRTRSAESRNVGCPKRN